MELVLASASSARRQMLTVAGVAFRTEPADIDEGAIRANLCRGNPAADPARIAEFLARAKAEQVSRCHPGTLVIGADQVLALDHEILSKPQHLAAARQTLLALRGRTHQLHSAVVLAEAGTVGWTHIESSELTMRNFTTTFLDRYLAQAGPQVCGSVGAYAIEGLGVQLFERVTGDHFSILGLPLLALLAELRSRQVIMA